MKLIFEYFIFCSGKFFKEHASINEMDCNFLLNGSYTEPTDYQKKKLDDIIRQLILITIKI